MSLSVFLRVHALTVVVGLGVLAPAVSQAAIVQLDFTGTSNNESSSNNAYSAVIKYDTAAVPVSEKISLIQYTDTEDSGYSNREMWIQNDVNFGSGPVDRLTLSGTYSSGLNAYASYIVLTLTSDFLPGTQVPTANQMLTGLFGGKLLSVEANGSGSFFFNPLSHTATINAFAVNGVSAVPEPNTGLLAIFATGLMGVLRRRFK